MAVRAVFTSGALVLATFGANAQPAAKASPASCTPQGDLTPICGVPGPEDIRSTPDGKALFVSQIGVELDAQARLRFVPGRLVLLNIATNERRTLFPVKSGMTAKGDWGEPGCTSPGEAFSPGGINLSTRHDGTRQLLAVNLAPHKSIEMFEVRDEGRNLSLHWRGCVVFPDSFLLNSVAALPTGGFVTTMTQLVDENYMGVMKKAEQGLNTGLVLRWQPGMGIDFLPGGLMPLANGIQVSTDGRAVFVASSRSEGEVRKIDIVSGATLGSAKVARPDNLSWSNNGKLIVGTGPTMRADCKSEVNCPSRYEIVAIDPVTMTTEAVRSFEAAPIAGTVSVAAEAGNSYYLGSATADRILKISRKQ